METNVEKQIRESQLQTLYDGVVCRLNEMRGILAEDLGRATLGALAFTVAAEKIGEHCYLHFADTCTTGWYFEPGGALHGALTKARELIENPDGCDIPVKNYRNIINTIEPDALTRILSDETFEQVALAKGYVKMNADMENGNGNADMEV